MLKKISNLKWIALVSLGLFAASCDNDDDAPIITPGGSDFDRPTVTLIPNTATVQPGATVTMTANVSAPGNVAGVSASATGGTVVVGDITGSGTASGSTTLTYTAPAEEGTYTVTVTATDAQSPAKTDEATAIVIVAEDAEEQPSTIEIESSVDGTGTVTWTKNNLYVLRGLVYVNDGQTLTIEPGTVIKGVPGQAANASALVVARGGRIIADGTAQEPIIFTALADDLNGSIPNNATGLWGGVIILGNGTSNNTSFGGERSIEGVPVSDTDDRGLYGGTNAADDSGILNYVSIRHGGSIIGSDNEINGLTLGAVGSGTQISNIEIFSTLDDGIEFFGGSVNVTNLVVVNAGDDGIDIDEGYNGTIQNAIVYSQTSTLQSSDPRGMELDGGSSDNEPELPYADPILANITLFYNNDGGNEGHADAVYFRDNYAGSLYNSIVINHDAPIDLERRVDRPSSQGVAGSSYDRFIEGTMRIAGNVFYNVNGVTSMDSFADLFELSDDTDATLEAAVEAQLMGADMNMVVNPNLGSGSSLLTPAAAVGTPATLPADSGLEQLNYVGAVAPGGTPFFAGWSKFSQQIAQ